MNTQGQVTIPEELREALGDEGCVEFEASVDAASRELTLNHVGSIPDEDAWAFTAEHRAALERARADVRAGRVRTLTLKSSKRLPQSDLNEFA